MEEVKHSQTNLPSIWIRLTDRFNINRRLILMKLHLFLFFGSISGAIPSMVSYTQQITGAAMVGILFSVLPFAQLLMKPVIGGISDKFRKHKAAFLISIVATAIAFFSINFIPAVNQVDDLPADQWSSSTPATFSCEAAVNAPTLQLCDTPQSSTIKNCSLSCNIPNVVELHSLLCGNTSVANCSAYSGYSTLDSQKPFSSVAVVNLTVSVAAPENSTRDRLESAPNCETLRVLSVDGERPVWPSTERCLVGDSFQYSCHLQCLQDPDTNRVSVPEDALYQTVWIWVASLIAFVALGTVVTTTDAMLLDTLGSENQGGYGKNRLYGSIGWGLFSVVTAQLIDLASTDQQRDYSPGYYLFLGLIVLDFLITLPMKVVVAERPKRLTKDVLALFKNPEFSVFAVATVCTGMVTATFWTYIILFANDLGGTQMVIGANYAVECFLSEIPFFLVSGWAVRKLGHIYSMTVVLIVSGFKALCYSFIFEPWLILIPALLHGANYGIFYATAATYASTMAPPGASATLQGLIQGLFEGLGIGLGNLFGGLLYEGYGGRSMFRIIGISTMAIGCLHFIVSFLLKRWKLKDNQR